MTTQNRAPTASAAGAPPRPPTPSRLRAFGYLVALSWQRQGREREAGNLLWVLTRPRSRPVIYLAKYLALLPWCLLLNLGGFAVICQMANSPGRLALAAYWPAVLWATLAFAALFHLMGAC